MQLNPYIRMGESQISQMGKKYVKMEWKIPRLEVLGICRIKFRSESIPKTKGGLWQDKVALSPAFHIDNVSHNLWGLSP
jgi:hypothetical protein